MLWATSTIKRNLNQKQNFVILTKDYLQNKKAVLIIKYRNAKNEKITVLHLDTDSEL